MLVLALDTTTRDGSCAVADEDRVLRERAGDAARPHDERLPGDLMALLDEASLALTDVDVYAVATGPGSFTGLRIGIATMQGLAFAAGKPLIGVSGFDALAHLGGAAAPDAARIATWVDAWRGEVYAAAYQDGEELEAPLVEPPAELLARYARRGGDWLLIGDAAEIYRDAIAAALGPSVRIAAPAAPPLAGTIAQRAAAAARAGHRPPPHAIRPLYVRRPDAELARNARPVR
jgi:tRNA threonylcarbamoyladenosine biosynthesis protein TsaB